MLNVGNGWVAGGCWDDDITSDEMDHSQKFPAFSTSKMKLANHRNQVKFRSQCQVKKNHGPPYVAYRAYRRSSIQPCQKIEMAIYSWTHDNPHKLAVGLPSFPSIGSQGPKGPKLLNRTQTTTFIGEIRVNPHLGRIKNLFYLLLRLNLIFSVQTKIPRGFCSFHRCPVVWSAQNVGPSVVLPRCSSTGSGKSTSAGTHTTC